MVVEFNTLFQICGKGIHQIAHHASIFNKIQNNIQNIRTYT